jgi:hypothetical protein
LKTHFKNLGGADVRSNTGQASRKAQEGMLAKGKRTKNNDMRDDARRRCRRHTKQQHDFLVVRVCFRVSLPLACPDTCFQNS